MKVKFIHQLAISQELLRYPLSLDHRRLWISRHTKTALVPGMQNAGHIYEGLASREQIPATLDFANTTAERCHATAI